VHHSVIIELNVPSFRVETAKKSKTKTSQQPNIQIHTGILIVAKPHF
jgi:hypothetical protein